MGTPQNQLQAPLLGSDTLVENPWLRCTCAAILSREAMPWFSQVWHGTTHLEVKTEVHCELPSDHGPSWGRNWGAKSLTWLLAEANLIPRSLPIRVKRLPVSGHQRQPCPSGSTSHPSLCPFTAPITPTRLNFADTYKPPKGDIPINGLLTPTSVIHIHYSVRAQLGFCATALMVLRAPHGNAAAHEGQTRWNAAKIQCDSQRQATSQQEDGQQFAL